MTSSADRAGREGGPDGDRWQPVGGVDPRSLGAARRLLHNMAQWPARIANSYVAGATWPERLRMRWDDAAQAVATALFDADLRLSLHLPTLALQFLAHDRPTPHRMDPQGRSPAEIEAWLLVELLHRDIDRNGFSTALPYSVPQLMSGDAEDYDLRACAVALAELAAWYHTAALAFRAVAQRSGALDEAGAGIAFWPHDLSLTCRLGGAAGAKPTALEMVFSPGRRGREEPYFHVGPESTGEDQAGVSAVLKTSTMIASPAPQDCLAAFLHDALSTVGPQAKT